MPAEPLQFKIDGMDCAEEVAVLKRELAPLVGGEDRLSFDLLQEKLTIAQDAADVTADAVLRAVARTGMKATQWRRESPAAIKQSFLHRHGRALLTAVSGLLTIAGFITHARIAGSLQDAIGSEGMGLARQVPVLAQTLYGLGVLAGVWWVLPRAWLAMRRMRPDMNLLMVFAVVGAAWLGDWFEASSVACLFSISLLLEKWSVGHARRAVEALLDLTPPTARLRYPDGRQSEVSPNQVPVGAILLVKPGERIPLDGQIVSGHSQVNQAPITGESLPVPKSPGDSVFAGTINGEGALDIETTRLSDATTLAYLVRMVSDAQARRSRSEQWVEKFAQIYTPIILGLSLAIFLIPPLLLGGNWYEWLYRSLVLLVIACPCALVISTPVSVVAAIAAAARQGVLIKGGVIVEIPARLRALAFDKTGTLTEGRPTVVGLFPWNGHTDEELLERIAGLEAHSEHPLGRAILAYAQQRNVSIRPAEDYQIVPGKGATARFDGKRYWLGSRRFVEERGQATETVLAQLDELTQEGATAVIVGNEDHVCGAITLADRVRPDARNAVRSLREMGVETIAMLTGDNESTAKAIARTVGIDNVQANLLPADKVQVVEQLVSQYGCVAMVGDGVNDAPAMARASLGIAMGAAGSDVALETADIALMSDDLSRIPWLVSHSRRTLDIIRVNIAFALAIKAIFVILTLVGFASLWAAIAADMGASFLVIFNGLRLLRFVDSPAKKPSNFPSPG